MKKYAENRVDFRDGRYYIKGANIRVDLVIGLGANEVFKNYPWLTEKQINDALDFAEESIQQVQAV